MTITSRTGYYSSWFRTACSGVGVSLYSVAPKNTPTHPTKLLSALADPLFILLEYIFLM